MNLRLSNIPPARRWLLGAVAVVVLAVGWVLTEPLRTGIRTHRLGSYSYFNVLFIERHFFSFSGDELVWRYLEEGRGTIFSSVGAAAWEFAPSDRRELNAVTSEDASRVAYESSPIQSRLTFVGDELTTHVIRTGQIFFVRRSNDPRTVYALQAVEQKDGRGHFRSRRILPGAATARGGSNAVPFTATNR